MINNKKSIPERYLKLFFYLGICVYLPYIFFQVTSASHEILGTPQEIILLIGQAITFGGLFIMDGFGFTSKKMDKFRGIFMIVASIIGAIALMILFINTRSGWNNTKNLIVIPFICVLSCFEILGWFFVRANRAFKVDIYKPVYNDTVASLLIGTLLILLEYFVEGALIIGLFIIFALFPFVLVKFGSLTVEEDDISEKKVMHKYERVTFYNFIEDVIKAGALFVSMMAMAYGRTALFGGDFTSNFNQPTVDIIRDITFRNMIIFCLFAALAIYLFDRIQTLLHGLVPVTIIFLCGLIQYLFVYKLDITNWFLLSLLNGVTLGGVYFFIEQKIDESDNIRAMPGSFYALIVILVSLSLSARIDPVRGISLETIKAVVCIAGLAFLVGYVRNKPEEPVQRRYSLP